MRRLLYGAAFVAIAAMVGAKIMLLAPIWLLGALLHYAPRPSASHRVRLACACCYPVAVAAAESVSFHGFNSDYLLAIATAALLWVLLSSRGAEDAGSFYSRLARSTAGFSFTLYVAHRPLITLIGCLSLGQDLWQPNLLHLSLGAAIGLGILAYAWMLASVTEQRTADIRVWVERVTARNAFRRKASEKAAAGTSSG